MYCVKCGVKLQEGAKYCPLCNTPVMIKENIEELNELYSNKYPLEDIHKKHILLSLILSISIMTALVIMIVCLSLYGKLKWGSIIMLSIALFNIIFILPSFFKEYKPMLWIPISFGSIMGYLLFIDLYTKGHWFLSFAFPVVGIIFIDLITGIALYRYIKGHRLYITGGYLIFIGCSSMLIELFEHITFKTVMFNWSLACSTAFSVFGIFILIVASIKPLRDYITRKFFI